MNHMPADHPFLARLRQGPILGDGGMGTELYARGISFDMSDLADTNLRQAGLREVVDLIHGDATQVVATLAGPFDCVFFDADRKSAPSQLALLLPKLTAEVFLFADNALSHPQEIAAYLAAVQALPQFEHLIIPIGKGLSMAYRQTGSAALLGGTQR